MNKLGFLVRALVCAALMTGPYNAAFARVTGASSSDRDVFCVGISADEVCVDKDGNTLPTTDQGGDLGTSSLRFGTVYSMDATLGDDLTVTDDMTVSDVADIDTLGLTKTTLGSGTGATAGIYTSTVVVPTSSYMTLISSGGPIIMAGLPSISTGPSTTAVANWASGTMLVLTSTSVATITFQDEGTLTGSRLQLGSTTRALGQYDILTLIYDATDNFWREVSFSAN